MKRILLSLLCATSVFGQTVSVDVQNTTATDLYLYQIDQGNITVDFKDGGEDDLVSGAAIFWYATNGLRSDAVVEIPVTVTSAVSRVLFPITADKFPLATPGSRPWTYGVEVAGKMHGDGRLYIKTRPAVTNATLALLGKTYIDWTTITNHVGTADYGPYQFTAGFAWTTNASGRLVLTSTAGTPAWGDVTGKPAWASNAVLDHATTSNLHWTASGHTGTPARVAGFFEGGAAGYAGFGPGVYLDGSDNIAVSNDVIAGAAAGATAVQPAALAGYSTTSTVAAIDARVTGVETGKVDRTDTNGWTVTSHAGLLTNETTTLATAAARGGFAGTETISPDSISISQPDAFIPITITGPASATRLYLGLDNGAAYVPALVSESNNVPTFWRFRNFGDTNLNVASTADLAGYVPNTPAGIAAAGGLTNAGAFATASQGTKADTAVQPSALSTNWFASTILPSAATVTISSATQSPLTLDLTNNTILSYTVGSFPTATTGMVIQALQYRPNSFSFGIDSNTLTGTLPTPTTNAYNILTIIGAHGATKAEVR